VREEKWSLGKIDPCQLERSITVLGCIALVVSRDVAGIYISAESTQH